MECLSKAWLPPRPPSTAASSHAETCEVADMSAPPDMEVDDDPWDQRPKGNNKHSVVVKPPWARDVIKHRGYVAKLVARLGKVLKWACHCKRAF